MKYRFVFWVLVVALWGMPVWAQGGNVIPYAWEAGNLALVYPAGWDDPLPAEADGRYVLQIAQALVDTPDVRPPGIPFITLVLIPAPTDEEAAAADLTALLAEAFQQQRVRPGGVFATTLLDSQGIMTSGTSPDGLLYGLGKAAQLPDGSVLVVTGRGLAEQRDDFTQIFDMVANSLVLGAHSMPNMPVYGVLWSVEQTVSDGQEAFLDPLSIAYGPDNSLYVLDAVVGVTQLDAQTGDVMGYFPLDEAAVPFDVAVSDEGQLYVADLSCSCVQELGADGQWTSKLADFDVDAPHSIAVTPDGSLYATDQTDSGFVVRVLQGEGSHEIVLGEDIIVQPLLAVDRSGRLLALTDTGQVLRLEGESFVPAFELATNFPVVTDMAVGPDNNLFVMTADQGVVIFDTKGNEIDRIGRVVSGFPRPGELANPSGLAVGPDGTVYWTDSGDSFGRVTAMSTRVESGRVGATRLMVHVAVEGNLSETTPSQSWTFDGTAGQTVTISAVDIDRTDIFNVALRLLAPDGSEEAYNDDQEGIELFGYYDAQIADHALARTGTYTIVVERVDGSGTYNLGISEDRSFELNTGGDTVLEGDLSDVFPKDRWVFQARAGQTFTITMNAESETLDPLLRLLDGRAQVIAENDDAEDPTLGPDSQLVEVPLSQNGTYVIEAGRFDGEGHYRLTISPVQ